MRVHALRAENPAGLSGTGPDGAKAEGQASARLIDLGQRLELPDY